MENENEKYRAKRGKFSILKADCSSPEFNTIIFAKIIFDEPKNSEIPF